MNSEMIDKISHYFNDHPEVAAVYVFGSYAKEKQKKFSDIDLAILLKNKYRDNEAERHRTYLLGLTMLLRIDVHLVSMNGAGEVLLSQIFKYGKCVVNNAPEDLTVFKMIKYAMIADFSYHKVMMEKGFINNIFRENR